MAAPLSIDGPPFDVPRIVAQIQEAVGRDREAGVLTAEDVEELARRRLRDYAEHAVIDPRLLDRFLGPGHDWNIAADYLIRSDRRGGAGRLVVMAKKMVAPVVRLYTDHALKRQAQINQYFFHLLLESIRQTVRLEARLAALEGRSRAGSPAGPREP